MSRQVVVSGGATSYGATGLPPGLAIDISTGLISGTPSTLGSYTVTLSASNPAGSTTGSLVIDVSLVAIRTWSLISGTVGRAYAATLQADALGPVTWTISAGALPSGLSLNAGTGAILGSPTIGGDFALQISATTASVSATRSLKMHINQAAPVICWGYDTFGQVSIPAGVVEATAIAAGSVHTVAVLPDATVATWGGRINRMPMALPPGLSGVVAVAAGSDHAMALKEDGTVVAWGDDSAGQASVPVGLTGVTAIACGSMHSMALKKDGTVVMWGWNGFSQCTIPAGLAPVIGIAAGDKHSLALLENGSVVGWGDDGDQQIDVPAMATATTEISAGWLDSMALQSDGTVAAWGYHADGQTTVPGGLTGVTHVAIGGDLTLALRTDGTVEGWTGYDPRLLSVPPLLGGTVAISTAGSHAVALGYLPPDITSATSVIAVLGEPFTYQTTVRQHATSFIASGLPAGLVIDAASGLIHGTPTSVGPASVTLGAGNPAATRSVTLDIDVRGAEITTYALPPAAVGRAYSANLVARGVAPLTWSISSGSTPAGLTLDAITGAIVGAPTSGGIFSFGITAANTGGPSRERRFRMHVARPSAVVAWDFGDQVFATGPNGFATAVAVSSQFTMVLRPDGTVASWGDNTYGQAAFPPGLQGVVAIGSGDVFSVVLKQDGTVQEWGQTPMDPGAVPAGLSSVVAIAAGDAHCVALKSDGTLACWGRDLDGESTPPAGLSGVTAIAAGSHHSSALLSDGTVVAWGLNVNNAPAVPPGLPTVLDLAAGGDVTLAVLDDGSLAGWGSSIHGQVPVPGGLTGIVSMAAGFDVAAIATDAGTVTLWGAGAPYLGAPSGLADVTGIAVGSSHVVVLGYLPPRITSAPSATTVVGLPMSFAITAIHDPTSVNVSGLPAGLTFDPFTRLISGTPTVVGTTPITLSATNPAGTDTTALSLVVVPCAITTYSVLPACVGGSYAFPLTVRSATASTWTVVGGSLPSGLGLGASTGVISGTPTVGGDVDIDVVATTSDGPSAARRLRLRVDAARPVVTWGYLGSMPASVPTDISSARAISCINASDAAILPEGTVRGWGNVSYGQTVIPAGLANVVALSAGDSHTLAVSNVGTVTGWGDDAHGQTTIPLLPSSVTAVAAGFGFSVVLTSDGTVTAWGDASYGRISVPSGLGGVTAISAWIHTLALTIDGTVVAWGDDTTGPGAVPSGLTGVIAVSAGLHHSLALKSDGTVVAWGDDFFGQCSVPAGLSGVIAIAAGAEHSIALKNDGTVVGWGRNAYGESAPPADLRAIAISAGNRHTLALGYVTPVVPSASLRQSIGGPILYRILPNAGSTSYGATGLPAGMAIDSVTGVVSGSVATAGTYPVVLSATNPYWTGTGTLTLDIVAMNQQPTLAAISDPAPLLEDSGNVVVPLLGIGPGGGENAQTITVTATSDTPGLIPDPPVTYASPDSNGYLTIHPAANAHGVALITVTARDDGGTASGGIDVITRTFSVTVLPVNDAPTFSPLADPVTILHDAGIQTLTITAISPGPLDDASQVVTITATSSAPTLIANPVVSYVDPASTATLTFAPAAHAKGTATITLTVRDDGGTASGGSDTTVQTFAVVVTNAPPSVPDLQLTTNVDTPITGSLSATDGDGDALTFSIDSPPSHGTLSTSGSNATYAPSAGFIGSDSFTYIANDGVDDSNTATVEVVVQPAGSAAQSPSTSGCGLGGGSGILLLILSLGGRLLTLTTRGLRDRETSECSRP